MKKNFPEAWFAKIADMFTSGIPDIIGCLDGLFFAIELKVGKNKPTRIQLYVMKRIEAAGGSVAVCRTVPEVMRFLLQLSYKKGGDHNGQSSK